jgi:hypothetical protein
MQHSGHRSSQFFEKREFFSRSLMIRGRRNQFSLDLLEDKVSLETRHVVQRHSRQMFYSMNSMNSYLQDGLKSKIATTTDIPHAMIQCIPVCCCFFFSFSKPLIDSLASILRPVNLLAETLITLRPRKEHKHDRNPLTYEIDIEQIHFHVDSKEISDLLHFIQFQDDTTLSTVR